MVGAHPFTGDHAPDSVDPAKRYDREPFGLYDENFTGFMGLHDVMARNGDKALPVYITPVRLQHPAGRGPQGGARRAAGAVPHPGARSRPPASPYVPVFSWYALHPTPWDPQEYTLLDKKFRPNLSYEALAAWGRKVAEAGAGG